MTRAALAALATLALAAPLAAQAPDSTGRVTILVRAGEEPVPDVTVRAGATRALTNAQGRAVLQLRAGARLIIAQKVGYHPDTLEVVVRPGLDTTLTALVIEEAEEIEGITVQATRTTRHIEDEPTRVEILAGADIAEKTSMRPQDLSNFVSEMSGVRIQQTAPGRGGAAIRIQGLRGQYTQVLNDGLPLAGSVPGGLMLMQLPPVDLQQVEVIKGAATALYGPGALGGVMNLVARRPDGRTDLVVSGRAPAGGDAFLWTSRQLGERTGLSLTADAHGQDEADRNGDGWMDLNGVRRFGLRPRLHWTGPRGASLLATVGGMTEHRTGGTMPGRTAPDNQPWDNGSDTKRLDGGVIGTVPLGAASALHYRAAATALHQDAHYGPALERGRSRTLFGEATIDGTRGTFDGVLGVAFQENRYRNQDVPFHDYDFRTPSLFGQLTWRVTPQLSATFAHRCDAHSRYGTICSPRLSALVRLPDEWAVRLSGGTGFFAPTPFIEDVEPIGLAPVAAMTVGAERGRNLSLDLTGEVGKTELTLTLFTNEIRHAVQLGNSPPVLPPGNVPPRMLVNARIPARTSGGEIFAVYDVAPIVVTAFYSYLWATELDLATNLRAESPRTPRHNAFVDLAYETHETWIALEVNWFSPQRLADDPALARSRSYANVELLASRTFARMTVYVNADNLFNVHQGDYEPVLRSARAPGEPWTVGQWAPVEGRLLSAGIRYHLR